MKKIVLSFIACLFIYSAQSQILFSEDFDGISGPTAGGPGTYSFPVGWLLRSSDGLTPNAAVNYVNEAWERREDFANNVADSAAFSTSWYTPAGTSNDWMWTTPIAVQTGTILKWNAVTYDALYPDGYEVRVMVAPSTPTGGSGVIGNQITNSTSLFSIAAENTTWTARQLSLNAYAGQTVYIGFRNNSSDKFVLLIDDVVAEVQVQNDVQVVNGSVSHGPYTLAPMNHLTTAQNILLTGSIQNMGVLAATNARLSCDVILNGTYLTTVQSAATASFASLATEVKTIVYSPTANGAYDFKFYPSFNETDQVSSNDTILDPEGLFVDPTQMRRDNATVVGALGIGAGEIAYIGQVFNFETSVNIASVSSYLTRGYAGRQLGVAIYNTNGSGVPTTLLVATDTLAYPDDSARLYTYPISGGTINLPSGKYAFLQIEFDSTLALGNTNAIFTTNSMFVQWPTNGPAFAPVESFGAAFSKPFVIYPNFDMCIGQSGGSLISSTQAGCGLSDGTALVALDAGYSILWEDNTTTDSISGLAAGIYTYTMSNAYCSFTDSVTITNPNAPTAAIGTILNANCFGDNGSASVDIQGGSSPYSILWSDGSTTTSITAPAGTYSATITDSSNCQVTVTNITITEPTAVTTTVSSTDETCPTCNDGTATATPNGGTAPYTYVWSNGGITNPITGLAPGIYNATVIDANGCQVSSSNVTVAQSVIGIAELANYGVVIYPNPAVDFLSIESTKGNIERVTLVDASGRLLSVLTKTNNTFTADMRNLAKGVYQVVIETTEQTIVSSVAKQ